MAERGAVHVAWSAGGGPGCALTYSLQIHEAVKSRRREPHIAAHAFVTNRVTRRAARDPDPHQRRGRRG
jgi:hypothetical protein